jgi:hypothetical protein
MAPWAPLLKLERILVPMGFSSAAEQALHYAVTLASKFACPVLTVRLG